MDKRLIDIDEQELLTLYPSILETLLLDRTTNKNIIWANDNYKQYNVFEFNPTDPIRIELITNKYRDIIRPRALKTVDTQKSRTKENAEVFTPLFIIKQQNDSAEASFKDEPLEKYVSRTWVEITCGEGPYIATRYDVTNGEIIPLPERQGFLDRKLQRISSEIEQRDLWIELAIKAYKSTYGFEWNGDSLLLARENLLFTFIDYYFDKFGESPLADLLLEIAVIISYNIFQMDGLTYAIPLSAKKEKIPTGFDLFTGKETYEYKYSIGKQVYIMDWDKNKKVKFSTCLEREGV